MVPPPERKRRDPSERLAKRLVAEGRVPQELADEALARHAQLGTPFEEALIEAGIPERTLLRHLAELYRVQYISAAKLGAAVVSKVVVQLVPKKIAQSRQVVPVMLDRKNSVLSVAAADPDDLETAKELEIATQVRTIKFLVARPAAVEAAIAKFYDGDDFAFSLLRNEHIEPGAFDRDAIAQLTEGKMSNETAIFGHTIDFDEQGNRLHEPSPSRRGAMPASASPLSFGPASFAHRAPPSRDRPLSRPPLPDPSEAAPPALGPLHPPAYLPGAAASARVPGVTPDERPSSLPAPADPVGRLNAPFRRPTPVRLTPPAPSPGTLRTRRVSDQPVEVLDDSEFEELPVPSEPPPLEEPPPVSALPERTREALPGAEKMKARSARPAPANQASEPKHKPGRQTVPGAKLESIGDPFQMAVVLVSLLEGNRKDLRGHSIQTARLVRKVCESFDVPGSKARAAEIAALIHDVGKASGSYHLTAYNVAEFDGHRTAAEKLHATPARVLESARLAKTAVHAVTHMYERYDGQGIPAQLKATEIPLESRILAICDSYTDLTNNPRNSFRRVLSAQEACEALREKQGAVFDPQVVDRFTRVVLGDELAQQLRSDCGAVLLVDPDVEETTVLELALLEKRYDVRVARSESEAIDFVESTKGIDLIVSEVVLSQGSGFDLLEEIAKRPGDDRPAFVFLSHETDSAKVSEALDAGAQDYLFKPLASQVVVAKIRHLLEQNHRHKAIRGVSGSLEEMSLPDIVQVLHQGRKTCALKINAEGRAGAVYFKDGAIVDATWGDDRGEEGFYALVKIEKGGFTVDPEAVPPAATIHVSAEMLLLEGLRRLDEANR